MTNKGKLDIRIEGFEPAAVENATRQILKLLIDSKSNLTFSGKVFLPTKEERWALNRSPHKHGSSKEHFGKKIHRRLIQVKGASFSDLSFAKLDNPQFSNKVQISLSQRKS